MSLPTSQPTEPLPAGGSRRRVRGRELVAWSAAGVGLAGLLLARDPNVSGSYGFCPLLATTGLDCPFCGGLRGSHALLQGDVATALNHNLLLPLYLAAMVVVVVTAVRRRSVAAGASRRWLWWGLGVVTALFFVVRNLPWFPYLDSLA